MKTKSKIEAKFKVERKTKKNENYQKRMELLTNIIIIVAGIIKIINMLF